MYIGAKLFLKNQLKYKYTYIIHSKNAGLF